MTNYKKCLPEYHKESPALAFDIQEETIKLNFVMNYFNKNQVKGMHMGMHFVPVDLEDLMNKLDKESFYMFRFKTEMCPNISMKHNYKD